MAVFNPANPGFAVDTRHLVIFETGHTIDTVTNNGSTAVTLGNSGFNITLTYSGVTTMSATDKVPMSGTFTEISYAFGGTPWGTLTDISPARLFADVITADAYRIFDGSDTINGSIQHDDLFAGYGGNDTFNGNGGGDNFHLAARGTANPVLTIKGVTDAIDTIFVEKNFYTGDAYINLRSSVLTSVDAITLAPGTTVAVDTSQIGAGIAANAVIGAYSGTATLDINKNTIGGAFDAASLQVHPNTLVRIFGTASAETLSGTQNGDDFYARPGADTLNGRGGNDAFWLEGAGDEYDTINGGSGLDTVRMVGADIPVVNGFNAKASSIEAWIGDVSGNAGNNTFDFSGLTQTSSFTVAGGDGDDTIIAPGFDFFMIGDAGNDTLIGGKSEDIFLGGVGADSQTGGGAADRFAYNDIKDSGPKKSLRDTITDFEAKSDKLWLVVDANAGKKDFQFFKFVKKEGADFKNKPGTVIWEQIDKAGTAKDMTVVYADNNGDHKADMAIQLKGLIDLKAGDFLFGYF